jgi:hypothetical protein
MLSDGKAAAAAVAVAVAVDQACRLAMLSYPSVKSCSSSSGSSNRWLNRPMCSAVLCRVQCSAFRNRNPGIKNNIGKHVTRKKCSAV